MNEKVIRIDLIKNLQEILSSIEDIGQELFALDDEVSQGADMDRAALFHAALSIAADIEKAKHIVYKLKAFQKRASARKPNADEPTSGSEE